MYTIYIKIYKLIYSLSILNKMYTKCNKEGKTSLGGQL